MGPVIWFNKILFYSIYYNNIKYKVQDYDFYVTITHGNVTIFQIRLQTLMKLVGQAKYLSIYIIYINDMCVPNTYTCRNTTQLTELGELK